MLGDPRPFCGVFVNRYHFRHTGHVWLRFHGWSFIYADEIKNKITAMKYNGFAFSGDTEFVYYIIRISVRTV